MRLRSVLLLPALSAVAGCTPMSTLWPAGAQSTWVAWLGWSLIVLMCLTILVMAVLVVVGSLRRRGRIEEHQPLDAGGGKRWIFVGGVGVPVTVLTVLFLITIITLREYPGEKPRDVELTIQITAHQWWWEADYLYDDLTRRFSTANEIHIPVGQPVKFELISADVIHSFWVPRLHGKLDVIPGHTNSLILEAEEPGIYQGQCAEYCGVQHAHMRFVVVAHSPDDYRDWAQRQRQPAPTPTDPMLVKGREAFETHACAMCHTIRGTDARGGVAPDLTHFGSRRRIAGVMPNTRARLQAWIVNAQSFKPGVRMPTLEQFDGKTLNALAAYLESLE